MCLNRKCVVNPYTRRSVYTDCGVCPACLQKKAQARKRRIEATSKKGYNWYFITLTYENKFLPYILKDDLKNHVTNVPVYRDFDRCLYRSTADYDLDDSPREVSDPIGYLSLNEDWYARYAHGRIPTANGKRNAVGVSYYKDVQDFFKRFRIYLKRKFNYTQKFLYYTTSEYGETSFRPHFHILLHAPAESEFILRTAVNACWRFDDNLPRKFEVARHASSYVSSYVNCDSSVPSFLRSKEFRPKHSYSQGFGMDYAAFSLPAVLSASSSNNLTYILSVLVKGIPTKFNLPIPKYVINRYFPKFKGYSQLSNSAVFDFVSSACKLSPVEFRFAVSSILERHGQYYYKSDFEPVRKSLSNAFERFKNYFPSCLPIDFAKSFVDVWTSFEQTKLRLWYENKDSIPLHEQYDNLADAYFGYVRNSAVHDYFKNKDDTFVFHLDPNAFHDNIVKSNVYQNMYFAKYKKRKVLNKSLVDQGYNY